MEDIEAAKQPVGSTWNTHAHTHTNLTMPQAMNGLGAARGLHLVYGQELASPGRRADQVWGVSFFSRFFFCGYGKDTNQWRTHGVILCLRCADWQHRCGSWQGRRSQLHYDGSGPSAIASISSRLGNSFVNAAAQLKLKRINRCSISITAGSLLTWSSAPAVKEETKTTP